MAQIVASSQDRIKLGRITNTWTPEMCGKTQQSLNWQHHQLSDHTGSRAALIQAPARALASTARELEIRGINSEHCHRPQYFGDVRFGHLPALGCASDCVTPASGPHGYRPVHGSRVHGKGPTPEIMLTRSANGNLAFTGDDSWSETQSKLEIGVLNSEHCLRPQTFCYWNGSDTSDYREAQVQAMPVSRASASTAQVLRPAVDARPASWD